VDIVLGEPGDGVLDVDVTAATCRDVSARVTDGLRATAGGP
jgi:hypothetical protein